MIPPPANESTHQTHGVHRDPTTDRYLERPFRFDSVQRIPWLTRVLAKMLDFLATLSVMAVLSRFSWFIAAGVASALLLFSERLWHGASPGKFALGLQAVNLEGKPVSFPQTACRNLPLALLFFFAPYQSLWGLLAIVIVPVIILEGVLLYLLPGSIRIGDTLAETYVAKR